MLDRIDLHVEVTPVSFNNLSDERKGEESEIIRDRVIQSREVQFNRFKEYEGLYANAQMPAKLFRQVCKLDAACQNLLNRAMEKLGLSARAYDRIMKVSRTISDLSDSADIKPEHVAEAIQYRSLDKENWSG